MKELNQAELVGMTIEELAKYETLNLFDSKRSLTEEELYNIREDFEKYFCKENQIQYATEILLLNPEELSNVWEQDMNIFDNANKILNCNLMYYMEQFLEEVIEKYSEEFEKKNDRLYDEDYEYEEEYDIEASIDFEEIEDELMDILELDLSDIQTYQSKIDEIIDSLSEEKQEIVDMSYDELLEVYKDKNYEEIIDNTVARIMILDNIEKAADVYTKMINEGKKLNLLENPRELCLTMINKDMEKIKSITLEDVIKEAQEKVVKGTAKSMEEKLQEMA